MLDHGARHRPLLRSWHGAARTSTSWADSQEDHELCTAKGDCHVFFGSTGLLTTKPAIRIRASIILRTRCYGLLDRYADNQFPRTDLDLKRWTREHHPKPLRLHVVPTTAEDWHEHLAVRNVFAWMLRRSVVGESLGSALIMLLRSLNDFRDPTSNDNVASLTAYMDEEGYLELDAFPSYAVSILRLAETFKLKGLYARAFAACASALDDDITSHDEFYLLSDTTRHWLFQASSAYQQRLLPVSSLFIDRLNHQPSLDDPKRLRRSWRHSERFRKFLSSFYRAKLSQRSPDRLNVQLLYTLHDDFKAVCELLIDTRQQEAAQEPTSPALDYVARILRLKDGDVSFNRSDYPRPLLPQLDKTFSNRASWIPGVALSGLDPRTAAVKSLKEASNDCREASRVQLVEAYQRFEVDSVLYPEKGEGIDTPWLAEARKIRWNMIYDAYSALQDVLSEYTRTAGEDFATHSQVEFLGVTVPPWQSSTPAPTQGPQWPLEHVSPQLDMIPMHDESYCELKPDIDYMAITHRDSLRDTREREKAAHHTRPTAPLRSLSLPKALGRSSTLRKSLRRLRPKTAASAPSLHGPKRLPTKSTRCETTMQRGDTWMEGLSVSLPEADLNAEEVNLPEIEAKDSSKSDDSLEDTFMGRTKFMHANPDSTQSSGGQSPISAADIEPATAINSETTVARTDSRRNSLRHRLSHPALSRLRTMSTVFRSQEPSGVPDAPNETIHAEGVDSSSPSRDRPERPMSFLGGLSRSLSVKPNAMSVLTEFKRRAPQDGSDDEGVSGPSEELYTPTRPSAEWSAMQMFFVEEEGEGGTRTEASPAWEQYAGLGGLTTVH